MRPPFEPSAADAGASAGHRQLSRGSGDPPGSYCLAGGDDPARLAWVESVVGRGEGAMGPMLDVALVVVPCGKRGGLPHAGGGAGDVVGPCGAAAAGLEARVKIRLDAVRASLSIPFVENLTRHVLTGPLVSVLLQGGGVAGGASRSSAGAGSSTSTPSTSTPSSAASSSLLPPSSSTLSSRVHGGVQAPADEGSVGVGAIVGSDNAAAEGGGAEARWEGEGAAAAVQQGRGGAVDGGDSWERLAFVKVRLRGGAVQRFGGVEGVVSSPFVFTGKRYVVKHVWVGGSHVPRGSACGHRRALTHTPLKRTVRARHTFHTRLSSALVGGRSAPV